VGVDKLWRNDKQKGKGTEKRAGRQNLGDLQKGGKKNQESGKKRPQEEERASFIWKKNVKRGKKIGEPNTKSHGSEAQWGGGHTGRAEKKRPAQWSAHRTTKGLLLHLGTKKSDQDKTNGTHKRGWKKPGGKRGLLHQKGNNGRQKREPRLNKTSWVERKKERGCEGKKKSTRVPPTQTGREGKKEQKHGTLSRGGRAGFFGSREKN